MKIIPAIDIIEGKCVRLSKGDYNTQKTYHENPLEVAKSFEDHGITHLHLVDLDGAKSNHIVNHSVLESICSNTNLSVDFGGGLKTDEDVHVAFESGASQITGGSIAVSDDTLFKKWLTRYGPEKIILGADFYERKVATHGWLKTSKMDVVEFIKQYELAGVKYVLCTDIAMDGMLQGVSVDLYREILQKTNIQLIASGGVSSEEDLQQLKDMGCHGAIVGKALYEGKVSLKALKSMNKEH